MEMIHIRRGLAIGLLFIVLSAAFGNCAKPNDVQPASTAATAATSTTDCWLLNADSLTEQCGALVGIGTTTPGAPLDVQSPSLISDRYTGQNVIGVFKGGGVEPADGGKRARFILEGVDNSTSPSLDFRINDLSGTTRGVHLFYLPEKFNTSAGAWSNNHDLFGIWTHGSGTSLVIDAVNGNVGIGGTVNPAAPLDVRSQDKISDWYTGQSVIGVVNGGGVEALDGGKRARFIVEGRDTSTAPSVDFRINDQTGTTRGVHLYYMPENFPTSGGSFGNVHDQLGIWTHGAGTSLVVDAVNGYVGIGTINPAYKIHVVGTAGLSSGTAWINASDARLKDVHGDYEFGLAEILRLNTVRFNYKRNNALSLPSDRPMVGFIAQEVQNVIPDAVEVDDQGYLSLNVDPIHWASINAVQELHGMCKATESKVELLENRLAAVESENARIKAENANLTAEVARSRERLDMQEKLIEEIRRKLGL